MHLREPGGAVPLPPIRQIGATIIQPTHRASCHCGGVVLELDLPDGIMDVRRCTCSMCRRKGAVMGAVQITGLRVVQGTELLSIYRFNTRTAEHYFCSRCGIYTHHRRRSKPDQYGFNLGCLEGVDPTLVQGVPLNDGVNHPADRAPTLEIMVSLWIRPARVAEFEAYERKAARIMRRHGGAIEKVIRISDHEPSDEEPPFEIHLLAFPSLDSFLAYRADSELADLAAERSSVILRTEIAFGSAAPKY